MEPFGNLQGGKMKTQQSKPILLGLSVRIAPPSSKPIPIERVERRKHLRVDNCGYMNLFRSNELKMLQAQAY